MTFQSYPNVRDETMEPYRNIFTTFHAKIDSKLHSQASLLNCHNFQLQPNNSHQNHRNVWKANGRGKLLDTMERGCLYPNLK